MTFFEGFEIKQVKVPGGEMRLRCGGSGPPLLLLHGNPQTHAMWHAVAPTLAEQFEVICPDLRGYGATFKPPATPDHAPYAKSEMANDMIALMDVLGHQQFLLAGHDRGGRVAHRLALDNPDRIGKLALLDIVPTIEHFERTDKAFAMGYYHWFWLAQPHPFPETLINSEPDAWFRSHTSREPKSDDFFHPDALADYIEAVRNPQMIRGMCEDYRAAASIDLEHDRASRDSGHKITCPLLLLWGGKGKIGQWYDPVRIWEGYSENRIVAAELDTGHYLAEENPQGVVEQFVSFFSG